MTTYLRLTNFCTFKRRETDSITSGLNTYTPFTTNEAGQVVPNPAYVAAGGSNFETVKVKCQFLYLAMEEVVTPAQEHEDIIELVIGDEIIPLYTDQVINISDRYGNIIEAGPLEIIGIKKYAGFDGKLHHHRLRTRKMKEC